MKGSLCDVCILEENKLTIATRVNGFSGLGKYKFDVCEKHRDFLKKSGWETLPRDKENVFLDFVIEKQTEIGNKLFQMRKG